jgi:hypothetical protein
VPFIRLSDNYIDNPKITALSDGSFRLWHEVMAFCRRHETDGVIPKASMTQFPSYTRKRLSQLLTPWQAGANPLLANGGTGYAVHDYLDWNLSKDEATDDRDAAKIRMRRLRAGRSREHLGEQVGERSPIVPDRDTDRIGSSEKESEEKPAGPSVESRAARLLDQYGVWYANHRHGAKLRLLHNNIEFQEACSLCALWDDDRLQKLATIVLTSDDDFIAKTDRSFKIFALKASWADDRLRQWEQEHGVTA